jgi:polyphosphate kinase
LVVREEESGVHCYGHIGTGNYNPKTARIYEDLGLLTADPVLGADLTQLFNLLTGYARTPDFARLLVAPRDMRRRLMELIDGEIAAGPGVGHITLKMNSLVDPDMIDALYRASQAGIDVDVIVRGICCLRPGVEGLSDNIRVRSIVGRYLEHSRIYRFANGGPSGGPAHYIGSADWMPRNLDRRVEVLTPVEAPVLQARLDELIEVELGDDTLAWALQNDATWVRCERVGTTETHLTMQALATERARRG